MKTYEISSAQNATFKLFKSLLNSKGIVEHGQALIFGKKAIEETTRDFPDQTVGIIYQLEKEQATEATADGGAGSGYAVPASLIKNIYNVSPALFKELDIFGSHEPILVVKVPSFQKLEAHQDGCYVYLSLQDPGNMGAMLRSAAAFGVSGILLGPGATHPFHPRSSRAASASLFQHTFFKVSPDEVKKSLLPLIGLDKRGEPLAKFKFPKKFIFVLGTEGPGLSSEMKLDQSVGIPIKSSIDSLNAPVAASIALYQWSLS